VRKAIGHLHSSSVEASFLSMIILRGFKLQQFLELNSSENNNSFIQSRSTCNLNHRLWEEQQHERRRSSVVLAKIRVLLQKKCSILSFQLKT